MGFATYLNRIPLTQRDAVDLGSIERIVTALAYLNGDRLFDATLDRLPEAFTRFSAAGALARHLLAHVAGQHSDSDLA